MIAQFFQSYLFAYLFWLSISLGSLGVAMLYYLVGGRWGVSIRRVAEAAAKTLWLMALLFIPIIIGINYIYPWTDPTYVASMPAVQHKAAYLNVPAFIIRAVVIFVIWILLSQRLTRMAVRTSYHTDPEDHRVFQRFSAIGLILYVLTMTIASVDWMMSLQPDWFSTMYGLLIITTQVVAGMAFAILLVPRLAREQPLSAIVTPDLYRDLGALLLAAVMFWAYLSYFQLLIIWAGNLPHEVPWYLARSRGGWGIIGALVFIVQFVVPFMALISLRAKRNPRILTALAISILVANLADHFWHIAPAFHPERISIHLFDLVLPVLLGAVWLFVFRRNLDRTPALVVPEPGTQEAFDLERGGHTTV